jgi:uroporphyrinogen decarboxylase
MRQAGRYLPQYQAVRSKVSFLELCKTPELAAEVTVTAQETLGVDAAILFADILLIAEPLGFKLEFVESGGPVIRNPFRSGSDLARLNEVNPTGDLNYVLKAVSLIRSRLKPDIPLIGFAGAPFTLASYLIEGGGSKDYLHVKALLKEETIWNALMEKLVTATTAYLNAQAASGVQALQLFDSWIGILSPDEFKQLVLPHLKKLIAGLTPGVPVIYFGTQTAPFFPYLKETGAMVVGVDWRTPLNEAWKQLDGLAVQGNLNPEVLLTDPETVRRETKKILVLAGTRPGHIFNLGHGILPKTPMENVWAMIETVKTFKY